MATALLGGVIRANLYAPETIIVSDVHPEKLEKIKELGPIATTTNNLNVMNSERIILAVKPQDLKEVSKKIRGCFREGTPVLSILAGITVATLRNALGDEPKIVRSMPNLPALIDRGTTAIATSDETTPEQFVKFWKILETVGLVVELPESMMDAVTGLSGTGPGFVYYLIEAFIAGGEKAGLSSEVSRQLTIETFHGAVELLKHRYEEPSQLRAKVTSRGGTTAAGIEYLDNNRVYHHIQGGIMAATNRAKELGIINHNNHLEDN